MRSKIKGSSSGAKKRKIRTGPEPDQNRARRRAERLSYAIWTIVGNQKVGVNAQGGSPLQAVLEVDETADRLRMVLRRLREVKGQLGGK